MRYLVITMHVFIFIFSISLFAVSHKQIVKNGITYTMIKKGTHKLTIEKKDENKSTIIWDDTSGFIKLHNIVADNKNIYLIYDSDDMSLLFKSNIENSTEYLKNNFTAIYPPIIVSPFYGFNFYQKNDQIIVKIVGNEKWIKKQTNHTQFFYQDEKELWIPLNDNNEKIYEDARSAIEYWFYNGNLKRWYPENRRGEIDKEIWFEQTPTTELRNYPMKLWSKEDKSEKINYPEEYKKIFSKERERLKVEEEKRIAEEKQKLQQKIFIILGILFLITFSGFLIKNHKKKKIIKDKNI